jgi:hypothetical protein
MRYQVRVAGKVFEGSDVRILIKRAVQAKRARVEEHHHSSPALSRVEDAQRTENLYCKIINY